jgi:hypothetical protein
MADLAVVAVIRVVTREAAAGEAAVVPEAVLPAGVREVPRAVVNKKAEQSRVARSSGSGGPRFFLGAKLTAMRSNYFEAGTHGAEPRRAI